MQPTFPPDHHFYRRRSPGSPAASRERRAGSAANAGDVATGYFARHRVPALDPSDPRSGH
jgi:hypothetical protein